MPLKPITIIGGGLAGLTLGIGLRQQSIPVQICETGSYPRHRVCGEFISGRGQDTLRQLGLFQPILASGALAAKTASFFWRTKRFPPRALPQTALCVSRFTLDALLAKTFVELGGHLRCRTRWTRSDGAPLEGIVRARGRRAANHTQSWRWFGVKAHARSVPLQADLELHAHEDGYVGLCRLPEGETNVCGLFRHRTGTNDAPKAVVERLAGPEGSILHQRLSDAEWDQESFCTVGGLSFDLGRAVYSGEFCIGDTVTMIPPFTGNGMSMALESAELALPELLSWSRGEIQWETAWQTTAKTLDAAFARRLWWANLVQKTLFCPVARICLFPLGLRLEACWQFFFERTR
jgi:2-polyprenyl-6-methoxyphenol hydroxylase-like FAD-dependent oxidoreductase